MAGGKVVPETQGLGDHWDVAQRIVLVLADLSNGDRSMSQRIVLAVEVCCWRNRNGRIDGRLRAPARIAEPDRTGKDRQRDKHGDDRS